MFVDFEPPTAQEMAYERAESDYQDQQAEHSYEVHTLVSEMNREMEDPENALPEGAMERWIAKGNELDIDIFTELARHREMSQQQANSDLPF